MIDDNEDPEDRAEREKRERDIFRMRPKAIRAGEVSLWTMFSGVIILMVITVMARVSWLSDAVPCVSITGILALVIIGPIAALVDLCFVVRLKFLGARGLAWPVVLAMPGAIVSTLLALAILTAA